MNDVRLKDQLVIVLTTVVETSIRLGTKELERYATANLDDVKNLERRYLANTKCLLQETDTLEEHPMDDPNIGMFEHRWNKLQSTKHR